MNNLETMGVHEVDDVENVTSSGGGWMAKLLGGIAGAISLIGDYNQNEIDTAGYSAFKNA